MVQEHDERENVPCIFCGTFEADLYAAAKSQYDERTFTVVQCRRCGLVYTNPRISNKVAEIENHPPPPAYIFEGGPIQRSAVAAQMQLLRLGRHSKGGRLLDFGCGQGVLVHQACQQGWDAVGADINRTMIQAANAYWPKQRLLCDNVDSLILKFGAAFDAIVSTEVLEHLCNPLECLLKMRSLLRPDGIVLVDVPNLRSLGERLRRGSSLNPTAHLYYFTPQTMCKLLEQAGFIVLQCSGSPNMLGVLYRICQMFHAPYLAPKLSEATQKIRLPQIGSGIYAIARMAAIPSS